LKGVGKGVGVFEVAQEFGRASTVLRVCCFKGLQTLPLLVARRQGIFTRFGVEVEFAFTTGSAEQVRALASGQYDLIQTAPDNVINFDTDPAALGLDPESAPRVVLLAGGSNGPLTAFSRPALASAAELRGGVLGVDNPSSGFALVLRDLLVREGLQLGHHYTFMIAGSTQMRLDALLRGEIDATILYPPFDLVASRAGCHALAVSTAAYPAYASQATAACLPWLEAHGDKVTRYLAAFLTALVWIFDPANRNAVEVVMASEPSLGIGETLAAQAYAAFTDPVYGFGREAALDEAGLAQVIALRAKYAPPLRSLGEPGDYYDLRWYQSAREMVRG
jgi:ABC-type nitrate/sulfonate/bicarbonate transport system substrate-binding protein